MKFSIVTPSYRQLPLLKRCIRSIADQTEVEVEHLIQDAGTGPELEAWVREHSRARLVVESDRGMYDAVNKGFDRASGEIFAYLNCDEQYLPGALARVAKVFVEYPEVDFVAGDYLIVDPQQRLLAYRKVTPLRPSMIRTDHLYAFTCALFFRRRVFEKTGQFDPALKAIADGEWVARALELGAHAALLREYTSTFVWTGENLGAQSFAREEASCARQRIPTSLRFAAPFLRQWRHIERLLAGGYTSGPIRYEVFIGEDDEQRSVVTCEHPSFRYPGP